MSVTDDMHDMSTMSKKITKKGKWVVAEVDILVEAVSSNETLQHKFSTEVTNAGRKSFWKEVTEKINAVGGQGRSTQQVEKKWRDLKSQTKAKEVKRRQETKKTGGGSADLPQTTAMEEKILGTLPSCTLDGTDGGKDTSSIDVQDTQKSTQSMTNEERSMHEQIEKVIAQNVSQGTSKDLLCESACHKPVEGKVTPKKRMRSSTEDFIVKMEREKVSELQLIRSKLESIHDTLKELLKMKKAKYANEFETEFMKQFEL